MKNQELKIEMLKTETLVPYVNNAKKHDADQVRAIAASMREFGWTNPVLIDKNNGIIAGHGRVLAAQERGMTEVPCIRLSHLTEAQRKAYIIADNRLAETGGGWDMETLKLELEAIEWGELNEFTLADLKFDEQDNDQPSPDVPINPCFEVIAECSSEAEQQKAYILLNEEGFKCRLSTL